MEQHRALVIVTCVFAYMVMCLLVGLWAMRRTKTAADFFMAGRNLGVVVAGIAVFSSTMSGFGFIGGPGLVYRMGASSLWMVVCSTIGFCVSFYLLGKRIRMFAELHDSISLPDAVAARYGNRGTAFLTAVAILLGVMGYLGANILAMATVVQSVLKPIPAFGELPLELCVLLSTTILVFYCVTGGIIASVYTDVVQGFIMIVAAALVLIAAVGAVDGGIHQVSLTILQDDAEAIGPWGTLGMLASLSWYFLFTLGGAGQPHVVTKMMMTRNVSDARMLLPISMAGYAVTALLWISIGLAMRALVLQGDHPSLANADEAAPAFLQNYTHPIVAGLVLAGLLAAIMSTADSFLNIGAAAIVHDIPRALWGRSMKRELLGARVATILIAVLASLFALHSNVDFVGLLGAIGWGVFAAALVPTVAIGFNWKRATPLAANVAIVCSLAIHVAERVLSIGWDVSIPYGISVGAISLLVSLVLFFGISLCSQPPMLPRDTEALIDL